MSTELQSQIFKMIRTKLPVHLSLVEEVATSLNISTDSAYRRLRGEKLMSLEEVHLLCKKYILSLDQLMQLEPDGYLFTGSFINPASFRFGQWLQTVMQQMKYMSSFNEKKMYQLLKDIPVFHHFHFREIAAFKHYVWMRGIFHDPELQNKKFSMAGYPDELFSLGQQALDIFNTINSVEIWNLESINSTIRQIEYYHETNLFENEEEVISIYLALEKLLLHLDKQAETGLKFRAGQLPSAASGSYEMYLNEMVIGDNSVLAILDDTKLAFLIHSVINMLVTRDVRFCNNLEEAMQNLMAKSTLISSVSEQERQGYFKELRQKIDNKKQSLGV